jgi:hypothetical protein
MELSPRGQRLWDSLLERDPDLAIEGNPVREIALTACRTADRVDELELAAATVDAIIDSRTGPSIHPVLVEVRHQAALLARLVAALRLPDEMTSKRPQRRQLRGVQQPSATPISALDRARNRSAG